MLYSRHLADQHVMHKDAYFLPIRLRPNLAQRRGQEASLFEPATSNNDEPNLSEGAAAYLRDLGLSPHPEAGRLLWMDALAVGYAPAYLEENADGLQLDWPRIPLPSSTDLLRRSSELGEQIADLLDLERTLPGISVGTIRPELRLLGVLGSSGTPTLVITAGCAKTLMRCGGF